MINHILAYGGSLTAILFSLMIMSSEEASTRRLGLLLFVTGILTLGAWIGRDITTMTGC